jgi:hypothetical protein
MSTANRVLAALEQYKLKPVGPNKYRCHSPLRPASNSHAFSLTLNGDEHGTYYDHVTHESGSLYALAKALHIEPSTVVASDSPTKRAYTGLADYAAAHGVPGDVLRAAGWDDVAPYPSFPHTGRPALKFATPNGPRYRLIDGEKPTYIQPVGYTACLYGLDKALELANATQQPLVLCNGEASTVVAQHYGMAAFCQNMGEKRLNDANLALLQQRYSGAIIIAPDCDTTGRTVAHDLTAQLTQAGYSVRAVNLNGHAGYDLADFAWLHGEDAAADVQRLAPLTPEAAPPTRRRLFHADELDSLPPPTWLVPGEIPAGGFTVLFGPSGTGKSFHALEYALRIAQEHNVVYIAAEGVNGYAARKNAWCQHHAKPAGGLHFWQEALPLLDSNAVHGFITEITPLNPQLIVVDTLARCLLGGDENSAKDMGLFIEACANVQRTTGAAVLVVHHTGKNGASERGSSALRGASDSMIELTNDDGLITVSSSKSKDSQPFTPYYRRLIEVGDSCVLVHADRVLQLPGGRLTEKQRKVLETLNMPTFVDIGAKTTVLCNATGIPEPTMYRMLSTLMTLGYITRGAKGDPYMISSTGIAMLEPHAPTINDIGQSNAQLSQLSPTLTNSHESPTINYHNYHSPLGVIVDDSSLQSERDTTNATRFPEQASPPPNGKPRPPQSYIDTVGDAIACGDFAKAATTMRNNALRDWTPEQARLKAAQAQQTGP